MNSIPIPPLPEIDLFFGGQTFWTIAIILGVVFLVGLILAESKAAVTLLGLFIITSYVIVSGLASGTYENIASINNLAEATPKLEEGIEEAYDINIESIDITTLQQVLTTETAPRIIGTEPTVMTYSYQNVVYKTEIYLRVAEGTDDIRNLTLLTAGETSEMEPFNPGENTNKLEELEQPAL